jgi:RHS repeat-associated protein
MDGVTGRNNTFITGASKPVSVTVDGSYVYWTNFNSGTIGRAAKAGTGVNQSFIVSGSYPWSVKVNATHIFWSNYFSGTGASGDKIGRADIGGTNINTAFVSGASGPRGIAIDGTYLYWANHTVNANGVNTIGRSLLNGTAVSQVFVVSPSTATTDLLRPAGLAVTPTHVLWSNSDVPKIGRAALTGPVDQVTMFLDGQEVVNSIGSSAVVSAVRYYSGSGLLATRSTVSGLTFVGTDSQGTLTATLTADGVTSTRQRYKPFGEQRGAPLNALPSERGFVGQVEDTAAGLSYLNARHYDAKNATFISVDPVLSIYDPTSLNAYIYGGNSPVVLSDPSGLEPGGPCSGSSSASCATIQKNLVNTFNFAYVNYGFARPEDRDSYWNQATLVYRWLTGNNLDDDNASAFKTIGSFTPVINDVIDAVDCATGSKSGCAGLVVPYAAGKAIEKVAAKAGAKWLGKEAEQVVEACLKSFSGDTRVLMADGSSKPFSDVEVGDFVLAQDPETGEVSAREVLALWVHDDDLVRIEVAGAVVRTTEDHPFWNDTDKRWERADELDVGDMLLSADGLGLRFDAFSGSAGRHLAYNMTVEGVHTYHVLAGDAAVLVYNACISKIGNLDYSDVLTKGAHIHASNGVEVSIRPGTLGKPVFTTWTDYGTRDTADAFEAASDWLASPRNRGELIRRLTLVRDGWAKSEIAWQRGKSAEYAILVNQLKKVG